jgi:hypothetical protein
MPSNDSIHKMLDHVGFVQAKNVVPFLFYVKKFLSFTYLAQRKVR